jgi:hypothetical protein
MPFTDPLGDLTYHVAIVGIWAMAEYTAIILVGCMPSFETWLGKKGEKLDVEKATNSESALTQQLATSSPMVEALH